MIPRTLYSRNEDMSPDGKLELIMQDDGDVIVIVDGYDGMENKKRVSVEFTFPGGGGGRSPNTRKALIELAHAMELDNKEDK